MATNVSSENVQNPVHSPMHILGGGRKQTSLLEVLIRKSETK